ncbi:MAG: AI-2E family transporter [Saprospiraceae bacterium]|nr:AI-2E family transporter [Saprospiraceae bacterium]
MNKSILQRTAFIFLVIVLAGAILYFGRPFLVPIALAGLLSMLLLPLAGWFEKKKLGRGLSSVLSVLVLVVGISGILALLSWQLTNVTDDLSQIKTVASERMEQLHVFASDHLGISREEQQKMMEENKSSGAESATKLGAMIVSSLLGALVTFIIAVVYIFMFLYYRSHFREFILQLVPAGNKAEATRVMAEASQIAQKYLGGLGLMITMLWVLYGIGFSIVGVKNAVFFAILCGILEIIPYVGNLTGTAITLLMTMAQGGDTSMMLGVIITYGLVQFFQNNVLTPLIVGSEVNINPVFTIMALMAGELVWGVPGMILAIPMLGILKITFDHIAVLKPFGFIIGQPKKSAASKKKEGIISKLKGIFKSR